jgi:hypothetical protein
MNSTVRLPIAIRLLRPPLMLSAGHVLGTLALVAQDAPPAPRPGPLDPSRWSRVSFFRFAKGPSGNKWRMLGVEVPGRQGARRENTRRI